MHQFNVFTVNTPMQHGARAATWPTRTPYLELPAFYQRKRDLFRAGLATTRLGCCPARAPTSSASTISRGQRPAAKPSSASGSRREIGVAAIPLSAFYADGFDQRVVRFCFAKKDETLHGWRWSDWRGSDTRA